MFSRFDVLAVWWLACGVWSWYKAVPLEFGLSVGFYFLG